MKMEAKAPVFIGGLFKSGTSLLRAMLGQHSQIAAGLETYWFDVQWDQKRGPRGETLEEYIQRLEVFFEMPETSSSTLLAKSLSAEDFLDRFMAAACLQQGKPRWAEKTPGNVRNNKRILAAWPEARILQIIRDPKDVLVSFLENKRVKDVAGFADLWMDYVGRTEMPANSLTLRYEQLILEPEDAMRQVLSFVNVPWENACAEFKGKADEFQKVKKLTGISSSTLERLALPLNANRMGLWVGTLSEEQLLEMRREITARGGGTLLSKLEKETEAIRSRQTENPA